MRYSSLPTWGLLALCTLAVAEACCSDYKLRVGKLGGRMDAGFDVAADVDFDWGMRFDFDFDWAGWAKISAATQATLDFDGAGSLTFKTRTTGDVDDDGVDEAVRLVAVAEDDPSEPDRVFASWEGDKYSFDQGMCYLLWWDGKRIELLGAGCDQLEPALHCVMTRGNPASLSCDVCNGHGACMECSAGQSVDDCIGTGEDRLPDEPRPSNEQGGSAGQPARGSAGQSQSAGGGAGQNQPAGGSAGQLASGSPGLAGAGGSAGSTATGGTDTGGVPNAGAAGSTGQTGGSGASAEWSTCIEEAQTIRSEARDCGLDDPLDEDTLCSERLSDVNICWLAVAGAGLFTSPCGVLEENITCGRMFP
ncbi:MAG: hypothetical protein JW940_07915 [Polyangiaceae bacterium]|nr:hypothetical protein [Polyangiaceae bacterium]